MAATSPNARLAAPAPAGRDSADDGIASLLTRFGIALDRKDAKQVAELFTADGVFTHPSGETIDGRDAIETFYRTRFAEPGRRTCHVWTNLLVTPEGETSAEADAVMTIYAFEPVVSETETQLRVGRAHTRCERGPDGTWRFAEHRFEMAFPLSIPLHG
jgi:uncharacterized protein (TIGR02246 family)